MSVYVCVCVCVAIQSKCKTTMSVCILDITHVPLPPPEPLSLSAFCRHSRYGGISVGGVNSQVRMSEAEVEASFRDLKELLRSSQVCHEYWHSQGKLVDAKSLFEWSICSSATLKL